MTPCRACGSREFWRLLGSDGLPLYPEAAPICAACHPPAPGAQHAIERVSAEEKHD